MPANVFQPPDPGSDGLASSAKQAILALLLHAYEKAEAAGKEPVEFAISGETLRSAGLWGEELPRLCAAGLVEDICNLDEIDRCRRAAGLVQHGEFVLTRQGLLLAYRYAACTRHLSEEIHLPRWDADCRELWFRGILVKHFPHAAPCQEQLLASFQKQHWIARIDCPFANDNDDHERLRNAVKKLNQHQQSRLIRFRTDGTGTGVVWSPRG